MLPEGYRLGHHYTIVRHLDGTNMSNVYLAKDAVTDREIAIKVIKAEASLYSDASVINEAVRLFEREARAIAMLDHPRILPLLDHGKETFNGSLLCYLVMPYRQEGSLAKWLQQPNNAAPLSPNVVTRFVDQAAEALQHVHNDNIIHQDVKPSNFLIQSSQEYPDLQLADFGTAKLNTPTATISQTVRGTSAYMAPEQWNGESKFATDQYALGVMAYQLLTGRLPFEGNQQQLWNQHLNCLPQPPSTLNSRISPAIDKVILRALEKDPQARFATICEFACAFREALQPLTPTIPGLARRQYGEDDVQAIEEPPALNIPPEVVRPARHNPIALVTLVIVAILVLGGIASFFLLLDPPGKPFLSDPLTDNNRGNQWDTGSNPDPGNTCTFVNGRYQALVTDATVNPFWPCMAEKDTLGNLSDFVYEVQMEIIAGDQGGIIFRADKDNSNLYYFYINQNGEWGFYRSSKDNNILLKSGTNSAIKKGLHQINLIRVVARGSTFTLYVNKMLIATIDDSHYVSGRIGVTADDEGLPTTVLFTNAKVWIQ